MTQFSGQRLSGDAGRTSVDPLPMTKAICPRAKEVELHLRLALPHDFVRRNWYTLELLHTETSPYNTDSKSLLAALHPLIDAFIT